MTGDRPLARRVLADQVKERLLEDILSGRLAPDSRIIETAIAKDLGISQAPVREALRGAGGPRRGGDHALPRGSGAAAVPTGDRRGVRGALDAGDAGRSVRGAAAQRRGRRRADGAAGGDARRGGPGRRRRRGRGGCPLPRADRRARGQRHAQSGVVVARAAVADVPHAHRPRRRPPLVGGAPRADPRRAAGARHGRDGRPPWPDTSTRSATRWPGAGRRRPRRRSPRRRPRPRRPPPSIPSAPDRCARSRTTGRPAWPTRSPGSPSSAPTRDRWPVARISSSGCATGRCEPGLVIDVKRIAELDDGIRETATGRTDRGTDDDDDDRRRPGDPARSPRAGRGGRRRRLGPDPEPGDAGRQHLQRLTGGRHPPGAARRRRGRRRGRAGGGATHPDRRGPRPIRRDDPGRRRARDRHRPAPSDPSAWHRPRPPHPAARARPRLGDPRLRGRRWRRHAHRLRQPGASTLARQRRHRAARRSGSLGRRQAGRLLELFADASPSPTSLRAGPDYRVAMLHVLGLRAVRLAIARLAGA